MDVQDMRLVRRGLRKLSMRALRRAMLAFTHLPRSNYERIAGDRCGCFNSAAFAADAPEYDGLAFMPMVRAVGRNAENALSLAYEEHTDWLHGECVREFAERGVAVESVQLRSVGA